MSKEWLHSIPRLIADNESSIQEECENLFLELVLERVTRAGHTNFPNSKSFSNDPTVKAKSFEREVEFIFPEGVLGLLREICNGEVTPWVKKICVSLGKKKRLKPKLASALQNIIRTSESVWLSHSRPIEKWTAPPGAWLLLSEVSAFLSKAVDWEFLYHHWKLIDKHEPDGEVRSPFQQGFADEDVVGTYESDSVTWAGDRVFLLQTISNVSAELPPEPAADLAHELLTRIEDFNMHSAEVLVQYCHLCLAVSFGDHPLIIAESMMVWGYIWSNGCMNDSYICNSLFFFLAPAVFVSPLFEITVRIRNPVLL